MVRTIDASTLQSLNKQYLQDNPHIAAIVKQLEARVEPRLGRTKASDAVASALCNELLAIDAVTFGRLI